MSATNDAAADARLRAAAPQLFAELARAEWAGTADNLSVRCPSSCGCCPACGGLSPAYPYPSKFPRHTVGHKPGCTLRAALRKATKTPPPPPRPEPLP